MYMFIKVNNFHKGQRGICLRGGFQAVDWRLPYRSMLNVMVNNLTGIGLDLGSSSKHTRVQALLRINSYGDQQNMRDDLFENGKILNIPTIVHRNNANVFSVWELIETDIPREHIRCCYLTGYNGFNALSRHRVEIQTYSVPWACVNFNSGRGRGGIGINGQ